MSLATTFDPTIPEVIPRSAQNITASSSIPTVGLTKTQTKTLPTTSNSLAVSPKQEGLKKLPTCQDGCVIFFLHIPKTGGQALGKTLKRGLESRGVLYEVAKDYHKNQFNFMWKAKAGRFCSNHEKKILVLELHTNSAPSYQSLVEEGFMDELRNTTASCGLPLFAFTLIRESVALDMSLFNHFCVRSHQCGSAIQEPTVENLLHFHPGNPQCQFLIHWPRNSKVKRSNHTKEDCARAYHQLNSYMDWIGVLERYDETIRVLEHVTQESLEVKHWNVGQNNTQVLLKHHHLNNTVVKILQDDSAFDRSFYEQAVRDYSLDMFGLS